MNRILWVLVLWFALAIFTVLQLAAVELSGIYDYQLKDYIITPGASLSTGILLLFAFLIPVFDYSSKFKILLRILLLGIFALVYSVIFILIMHLFPIFFSANPSDYKQSIFRFAVANFHNVIKNYFFQIAILYVFEYIGKEKILSEKQKQLEIELGNTKLQMLKSQLQPHFLFNALNSVVSEIDENPKKAQEMLINISDILRTSLNNDFTIPTTLYEETELIKKYLFIEKMRYEDQLNYKILIDEAMMQRKIPNMILQPLVENAIKHGYKNLDRPLNIIIGTENDSVFVKNNGQILNTKSIGIGLNNVSHRMEIFTGKKDSFKIFQEGNWVINKITL